MRQREYKVRDGACAGVYTMDAFSRHEKRSGAQRGGGGEERGEVTESACICEGCV